MARKKIVVSSAGGIEPGSPFVKGGALFVEQVNPPFAFTQRLAALQDAAQSIIAPGAAGAPHSFVLGENAVDSVHGDRAVVLGYNVLQSQGSTALQDEDQILIGNTLDLSASLTANQGLIAIGAAMTFTRFPISDGFAGTIIIGYQAKATGLNQSNAAGQNMIILGAGAEGRAGGCVAIGPNTLALQQGIAIGQQAGAAALATAVGVLAGDTSSGESVSFGHSAKPGMAGVAVGGRATAAGGNGCVAIGQQADASNRTNSMAFGALASVGTDGMVLFGSRTNPVLYFQWGAGENDATGNRSYRFSTTYVFSGAGNNLQGNTLQIVAGGGTGNWPNAENLGLDLMVGAAVASGSTSQSNTSVLALRHSDLNVALWGGLGATMGGGKQVLYIANATTVPTGVITGGGILYTTGGQLHFLSSGGVDTALTPGGGGGGVTSVFGRTGVVVATTGDYTAAQVGALALAGGTMTGDILFSTANARNIGSTTNEAKEVFTRAISSNGSALTLTSTALNGDIQFNPDGVGVAVVSNNLPGIYPGAIGAGATQIGGSGAEFSSLFLKSAVAITLTSATTTVGAQLGTLTNAPTAGNPTGYLRVNINGAVGKIPYWV